MKRLNLVLALCFSTCTFGCYVEKPAALDKDYSVTTQPTVSDDENSKRKVDKSTKPESKDPNTGNEITDCSPKKIYRGETLTISFSTNHGGHLAIYPETKKSFYFIESENLEGENPQITETELKKLSSLELNTETTRKTNFNKVDKKENFLVERVFNKTGWYRIVVAHEGLDVDFIDMPVTGSCRIYYIDALKKKEKHKASLFNNFHKRV